MKTKLLIFMFAAALLGCAKTSDPNAATSGTGTSVAQSESAKGAETSPQTSPNPVAVDDALITVDTPPEVICRAFIDCLRRGDHSKAEKFLSQESITQTRKHSLDLAMPAGKDAQYTIDAPIFATNQQKIAFVSIEVTEPPESNVPPQSFSMMLRNGNFGWKIAGMMFGSESTSQDLYSFENPLDVLRIKSMLEGESRQARAPDVGGENRYQ